MSIIERVKELLHTTNCSCVVASANNITTYHGRGVSDLYNLYNNSPSLLKDAIMADKVVGKGAATLMIAGGINELYTDVISVYAYELLVQYGVKVSFKTKVDYIINRAGAGGCPLETLCASSNDIPTLLEIIDNFIKRK